MCVCRCPVPSVEIGADSVTYCRKCHGIWSTELGSNPLADDSPFSAKEFRSKLACRVFGHAWHEEGFAYGEAYCWRCNFSQAASDPEPFYFMLWAHRPKFWLWFRWITLRARLRDRWRRFTDPTYDDIPF